MIGGGNNHTGGAKHHLGLEFCIVRKGVFKQNGVELVKEILLMLLNTLRGQYEAITSEPDFVIRKQQLFQEI